MSGKVKMFGSVLLAVIIGLSLTLLTTFAMQPLSASPEQSKTQIHEVTKSQAAFVDVTTAVGINATHTTSYSWYYPTGQAWADYDQDGWLDLYLTNNSGPNKLYKNNGDGTFALSPLSSQVALTNSVSGGAVFADFNNDGWRDLYVLNEGPNKLYKNNGGTSFIDITLASGVGDSGIGTTGAWGDYDEDGYLDLYVANWGNTQDILYHNNGDDTFTDVSAALVYTTTIRDGFAVSFMDYDNDGDLDIYVVNDKLDGNVLWQNDGPGPCPFWCFTDVSQATNTDTKVNGMGLATGDYDNDGDLDFYFSDIGPSTFLQNQTSQGSQTFIDVTVATGTDANVIGWGTFFFDYNNDGWLDLYLAVMNHLTLPNAPNRLFHNLGTGAFADVSSQTNADDEGVTIGVAYADYDQDGWLDIIMGNRDEAYHLYRNMGGESNNWITFDLIGSGSINRDAIGSRLYVQTTNGQTQMQEVKSGSSLGAGNDLALHFGLGSASQALESIQVVWADGRTQTFNSLADNRIWHLAYPIELQTTIGTNASQCATSDTIAFVGTIVATLCYTLTNTAPIAFDFHTTEESVLDTLPSFYYSLAPGASLQLTRTVVLSHSLVNTTSWFVSTNQNHLSLATDAITATQYWPYGITLTATVGHNPGDCAATKAITTTYNSEVTYCYTVTNNNIFTYTSYTVTDSYLGSIVSNGSYTLSPGASFAFTHTRLATETAVHHLTWRTYTNISPNISVADTDALTVTLLPPTLLLTATVGQTPAACALTQAITTTFNSEVTYCYTVTNNSAYTFTSHTLIDSSLGAIITNWPYTLSPEASYFLTYTMPVTETAVHTISWIAQTDIGSTAINTDAVTVTLLSPTLLLTATVGQTPTPCAIMQAITTTYNNEVTYCYTVTNNSAYTFTSHSLTDSSLGAIITNWPYTLSPETSYFLTYTLPVTETAVHTVTWTAQTDSDLTTFATDVVTVTVLNPPTIIMTATVGHNPGDCALTQTLTTAFNSPVTYCYTVTNNSIYTYTSYTVTDSYLGSIVSNGSYTLSPGTSYTFTYTTLATQTAVHTVTWQTFADIGPGLTAIDTDVVTLTLLPPTILLTATVGHNPGECALSQSITTTYNSEVTYCYTVTNNSAYTFTNHTVTDSILGPIMTNWPYVLPPESTYVFTYTTLVTETAVHLITWAAQTSTGLTTLHSDTVTVTLTKLIEDNRIYLPFVAR